MKRRVSPTLIAMMVVGALAAQAQAQPHSPTLGVASGKTAINRFARTVTYRIADIRSAMPLSWQVFACGKRRADVICTAEWLFASEKCSVGMEALPARPAIRVRELGKLECSEQNTGE